MRLKLKTGGELELADLDALDEEIEATEEQLSRLRRLRKVTAELQGVVAEPATPAPHANAAAK